MARVLRLKSETYLELRNDEAATGQAVAALFFASLSYAIGFALFIRTFEIYALLVAILSQLLLSMIAALVWAIVVFFVATRLFKGKASFLQLARPLFFSSTPGTFFFLIAVPVNFVYDAVTAAVFAWIIVGGVIALKNSMGFGYNMSMLTYLVGFLGGIIIAGFFGL